MAAVGTLDVVPPTSRHFTTARLTSAVTLLSGRSINRGDRGGSCGTRPAASRRCRTREPRVLQLRALVLGTALDWIAEHKANTNQILGFLFTQHGLQPAASHHCERWPGLRPPRRIVMRWWTWPIRCGRCRRSERVPCRNLESVQNFYAAKAFRTYRHAQLGARRRARPCTPGRWRVPRWSGRPAPSTGELVGEMRRAPRCRAGVAVLVDLDAQPLRARDSARDAPCVVLAHPGGERDDVGAAEHGQVGADVLAQPVDVDVEASCAPRHRRRCARCSSRKSISPPSPSMPECRLSSSSMSSTSCRRRAQVEDDARVDVAAAGAHHQALERRQAHRGVDRRPPTIAEADAPLPRCSTIWLQRPTGRPRNSRGLLADVLVGGAVEAVAADLACAAATSRSIAYVAAAAGRSWKNAVSNTATCGTSGSALRATSMPAARAGCAAAPAERAPRSWRSRSSSTTVGR